MNPIPHAIHHTTRHTTQDELDYIDGIGTWTSTQPGMKGWKGGKNSAHRAYSNTKPLPMRVELLRNYVRSCRKRVKWGEVDREVAIRYAKNALREACA